MLYELYEPVDWEDLVGKTIKRSWWTLIADCTHSHGYIIEFTDGTYVLVNYEGSLSILTSDKNLESDCCDTYEESK